MFRWTGNPPEHNTDQGELDLRIKFFLLYNLNVLLAIASSKWRVPRPEQDRMNPVASLMICDLVTQNQ